MSHLASTDKEISLSLLGLVAAESTMCIIKKALDSKQQGWRFIRVACTARIATHMHYLISRAFTSKWLCSFLLFSLVTTFIVGFAGKATH